MKKSKLIHLFILCSIFLSGCTSMYLIENTASPSEILESIEPGDLIHVETIDGSKHEIKVTSIDIKTVKSIDLELPLEQIKTVKKQQISTFKTTGAVIAVSWIGGILAILAIY